MSLYTYVGTPNSNLVCCICQTPFMEPTTTTTCAHTFCFECILRALHHAPLCPIDRSPLSERDLVPADPIIRSLVEELEVECVHSGISRCDWKGQRQWLVRHLREECGYGEIECDEDGCSVIVARHELGRHIEQVHSVEPSGKGKDKQEVKLPLSDISDPLHSAMSSSTDLNLQHQQQKTIELLMEQNMLLKHRVEALEGTVGGMKKEMGAVKSVLGPWFRSANTTASRTTGTAASALGAAGTVTRLQIQQSRQREQSQTYQARVGQRPRVESETTIIEDSRGSERVNELFAADVDEGRELPDGADGVGLTLTATGPRSSPRNGDGRMTMTMISGTQLPPGSSALTAAASSANASSAQSGSNAAMTGQAYTGTATHGHGHRVSLSASLPGDVHGLRATATATTTGSDDGGESRTEDPLAGYFPTLGEFGIMPPQYHYPSATSSAFMHQQPGVHHGSGIPPGMGVGGLSNLNGMNPHTATRVAPLDLGTDLVGTLEGLRESVVGIAVGVDSLGRRSEIALANETLRLGEEVISLRTGVHGLRMQIHAMMMERNMQATGSSVGRDEGVGGPWFGMNGPRMYSYGGPPNITKL